MTSDAMHQPDHGSHDQHRDASGRQPCVEARWERPVVAKTGGEATLLVRVVAPTLENDTAGRAAPLDIAFVLDRSGSMAGGKLELAKVGVDLAVARLCDVDRTALVVYDHEVDPVQPLAAATPRMKASLRLALHGVDPGGSTFLSGGWVAGCQELAEARPIAEDAKASTRIRRVILLTDGLANVGMLNPGELARHAGELRQRGIATTTLGVGRDFDEGLLSAMAEAGGGNFQYVADADELRTFFTTELQELFSVAATGFTVTLRLPAGVGAELVSAFPVEARENALEVAIGDLPAADEIDLVFTIRAGQGAIGNLLPVGVTACWTDPRVDARRETDASPEPLERAEPGEVTAAAVDQLVAERAALQRAAAERRAGLELDRAGRLEESRDRMVRAYQLLEAAPMSAAVQADLQETESLAFMAADAAYGSHVRKSAQHREDLRRRGRFGTPRRGAADWGGGG
ncbi:MAG: vWA domain-containing protein [Thermomicrobiales bacterium]